MNRLFVAVLISLATAASACHDPLGVGGVRVSFDASRDTVLPGDTVEVVFTLRNRTISSLTIRSSAGCLYFLEVRMSGESVPWKGSDYLCTAAITRFTIAPGDSLRYVHQLVAVEAGTTAETPVAPGSYVIRARMNSDLTDRETEVIVTAGN